MNMAVTSQYLKGFFVYDTFLFLKRISTDLNILQANINAMHFQLSK